MGSEATTILLRDGQSPQMMVPRAVPEVGCKTPTVDTAMPTPRFAYRAIGSGTRRKTSAQMVDSLIAR